VRQAGHKENFTAWMSFWASKKNKGEEEQGLEKEEGIEGF
jgi:hypothetical protein